jgi:hypothetical protein
VTSFAVGRRWLCVTPGRARFWFVIVGPGENYSGKPSKTHKRCALVVHPDDIANRLHGYRSDGTDGHYSHKHLKEHAVLEPEGT